MARTTSPTSERRPLLAEGRRARPARAESDADLIDAEAEERKRKAKPWWRRPGPAWLIPLLLLISGSVALTIAARVEVFTRIICEEIFPDGPPPPNSTLLAADAAPAPAAYGPMDGTWSRCRTNPDVQARASKLVIAFTLFMGILAALTAGFWGGLSDTHGRRLVFIIAVSGLLWNELVVLFVVLAAPRVPIYLLFIGPIVDGICGGLPTLTAVAQAYISDTTLAGSRTAIFAIMSSLSFVGIAIGPLLGTLLLRIPGSTIYVPFYVSSGVHAFVWLFFVFFVPESVTRKRQDRARTRRARERLERKENEQEAIAGGASPLKIRVQGVFAGLRPIRLLLPIKPELDVVNEPETAGYVTNVKTHGRRDIMLTLVSVATGVMATAIALYQIKPLYVLRRFNWGPEKNGLYIGYAGACRAFSLLIFIPLTCRFFKSRSPQIPRPPEADTDESAEAVWRAKQDKAHMLHDVHFDLGLGRISALADVFAYLLITISVTPAQFILSTAITALAGGVGPSMQSIALMLRPREDSGQVLASLGIVHGIAGQVVGPLVYGVAYARNVRNFPEAPFVVGSSVFFIAFIILAFVRLPPSPKRAVGLS